MTKIRSSITFRPNSFFARLHEDFLAICADAGQGRKGGPGRAPHCAAMVLAQHLMWNDIRAAHQQQARELNQAAERGGGEPTQDTSLWVYKSQPQMQAELFDLFGEKAVGEAYSYLVAKNYLKRRRNPWNPGDNVPHFLLNIPVVQAAIDALPPLEAPNSEGDGAPSRRAKVRKSSPQNCGDPPQACGDSPQNDGDSPQDRGDNNIEGNGKSRSKDADTDTHTVEPDESGKTAGVGVSDGPQFSYEQNLEYALDSEWGAGIKVPAVWAEENTRTGRWDYRVRAYFTWKEMALEREAAVVAAGEQAADPTAEASAPPDWPAPPAESEREPRAVELWAWASGRLRGLINNEQSYATWFASLIPVKIENDTLILWAPNEVVQDWIGGNYLRQLTEAVGDQLKVAWMKK
jgi:hypothetical protein